MVNFNSFIVVLSVFALSPLAYLGYVYVHKPILFHDKIHTIDILSTEARNSPLKASVIQKKHSVAKPIVKPILPPESDLWLPEINHYDKVDLSDPSLEKLQPYSLYKVPTEEWFERATEKLKFHEENLKHAINHVVDDEQRITVVSCLFDLGRDKLEGFTRTFDEYIQRFQAVIDVGFPMLIFMETRKISQFDWSKNKKVMIIPFEIQDLVQRYPKYFERIEQIRSSPLYLKQARHVGWLIQSPQASLKHYNLMVMTKMFLLRYAAKLNPFHTQYQMFLDAGHLCGPIFDKGSVNLLRQHMGRMMVTYFDYFAGLHDESHGMPQMAYRSYVGPPYNDEKTWGSNECCRIVRGGIFGGTPAYIDAVADAYNEILAQSLADGYMGTEENILGATYYRFPHLFNAFSNAEGGNCGIFTKSKEMGVDTTIYKHGPTPDQWHDKK